MRLYPMTDATPKPLVTIGQEPVLYQLMKYYSYFGHKDFILCLGYKGDLIQKYFTDQIGYDSIKPALQKGTPDLKSIRDDLKQWNITFVETGLNSNIGQRLKAVQRYLEGENYFLANYTDAVTDLHLPSLIDFCTRQNKIACMIAIKPFHSYHVINTTGDGIVSNITPIERYTVRINGGFFVFKNEIFKYLRESEELVEEPFQRLILQKELLAYEYNGFWANMDTYKDKKRLDDLATQGKTPWQVWLS
jgi:glucose-1-phosphate cytidylyltransferase